MIWDLDSIDLEDSQRAALIDQLPLCVVLRGTAASHVTARSSACAIYKIPDLVYFCLERLSKQIVIQDFKLKLKLSNLYPNYMPFKKEFGISQNIQNWIFCIQYPKLEYPKVEYPKMDFIWFVVKNKDELFEKTRFYICSFLLSCLRTATVLMSNYV